MSQPVRDFFDSVADEVGSERAGYRGFGTVGTTTVRERAWCEGVITDGEIEVPRLDCAAFVGFSEDGVEGLVRDIRFCCVFILGEEEGKWGKRGGFGLEEGKIRTSIGTSTRLKSENGGCTNIPMMLKWGF